MDAKLRGCGRESPGRATLAASSFFKVCYLCYLSKPAGERILYRIIQKHRVHSILEMGIGTAQRAIHMIEMAQNGSPEETISYVGIDLFESRQASDGPGVSLKKAHQILGATGARIQLMPGDPFSALARSANGMMGTDLVVISARQDRRSLERAWFYLPRIVHAGSHVFREERVPAGGARLELVGHDQITALASRQSMRRAA
jgi:hypothetical protein